jgi:hypothetical protein
MNANANVGDDEIWLAIPLVHNLTINGNGGAEEGDLDITDNVVIYGQEVSNTLTIIDAAGMSENHRIFEIASGVTVTIRRLWLKNGDGDTPGTIGGAIYNRGTLYLDHTYIGYNDAFQAGGGIFNEAGASLELMKGTFVFGNTSDNGGGIWNNGTLLVNDSAILNNTANDGGGLYNIGTAILQRSTIDGNANRGITNHGSVNAINCTMINNQAPPGSNGGAIMDYSTVSLTNVTFYGNSANSATAVYTASSGNTTFLNNLIDGTCARTLGGTSTSLGGNLLISDSGCPYSESSDRQAGDAMFGPEGYNGGLVYSSTLLPGSPAIDAASNLLCPDTDQRGRKRPVDGDGGGSPAARCDSGAYEYDPSEIFIDGFESGDKDW